MDRDAICDWPDELRAAFIAAWAELTSPTKSSTANAGTYSYSYADLASVDEHVRPVLAQHGLATSCDAVVVDRTAHVSHSLLHASGVGRTSWLSVNFRDGDAQALGSALTYLRRYQLLALFGLATADDDARAVVSQPQRPRADLQRISKLLEQLGVPSDERRSVVEFELGRPIEAATDVTVDESPNVIAALAARLARAASTDSDPDDDRPADEHTDPAGSDEQ